MYNIKIKDWYLITYPTDTLGEELNPGVTFGDLFDTLDRYGDVYKLLGGDADSVIRSRCFAKLAELMDCSYDYIYDQWLKSA